MRSALLRQTRPHRRSRLPGLRSSGRSDGLGRRARTDPSATALLQTGDSYSFTPAASIRCVEETFKGSHPGALSPASAFGADFAFSIKDTTRIDVVRK